MAERRFLAAVAQRRHRAVEIRPSVTMARRFGISAMVASRKARQVLISAGLGLFSGGTQRTALVMRASTRISPSSGRAS